MTDAEFDAAVMAGPIVDMVGDGRMEYDGPRCAAEDCDTAVDGEDQQCPDCRAASRMPFEAMTVDAGEYRRADRVWL